MVKDIEQRFEEHWKNLSVELGLTPAKSEEVFAYLKTQYSGKARHYHSTRHIVAMLDGMQPLQGKFEDPVSARLAIFFHDVIYDAAKGDNEEQSALKMKELLKSAVKPDILESAASTINATKMHAATASRDTNLVLDLDMAIVGQPWAVYERYAKGVMQEYLPVYKKQITAWAVRNCFWNLPLLRAKYF